MYIKMKNIHVEFLFIETEVILTILKKEIEMKLTLSFIHPY